jgi:hypothetical protein
MPVTGTLLDQAHNAIERKLFAMKAFTTQVEANKPFSRGWPASIIWCRISVGPSMVANAG